MRMRVHSLILRNRSRILSRKQKMESRRRGKRKSPSQDIIFEVSDDDMSPEQSENECSEPQAKIFKTDENNCQLSSSDNSNLEIDKQIELEIPINPEESPENSIDVTDCVSVSNNSSIENFACISELIVINDVNILSEDTEPIVNSPENSVIDISDDNSVSLNVVDVETVEEGEVIDVGKPENEIIVDCSPCPEIQQQVEVESEVVGSNAVITVENPPEVDTTVTELKPCICITFGNNEMAELYKFKFLKFIQSFVELEVENYEGLSINVQRDSVLNASEWVVLDDTLCVSEVKEPVHIETSLPLLESPENVTSKKKKKKKAKKEKELFVLDTNPSQKDSGDPYTKYCTKFQIDTEKPATEDDVVRVSAQTCFNCDSNHAIRDCPLPKDFAKINAARQRFKAQKQTSRYHLEEDQKYAHIVPGKISDKLREALGLRSHQLPPFIYQMRLLGYPPGWLEEAKFVHSNLAMFDSEGNDVRASLKKKQGLDPKKIIDYPGFNVSMETDVRDEYRQYRVPPFSEEFGKQAMVDFFEQQYAKQQDDLETYDMDIDITSETNKEPTMVTKDDIVIVNPLISELKELESNLPSPSLTDLEKQKENLLAALEDSSQSSCQKSLETASVEEPEKPPQEPQAPEMHKESEKPEESENSLGVDNSEPTKVPLDETLEIDIEKAEDTSISYASPPLNDSVNTIKTSSFGTPILKSSSPYSRLPNPDNFTKDVSPVINFENLPNSTGKYEQMTGVLQKVRSTLRNLSNCKS